MEIKSGYYTVWTTGLSSILHMLWKLRVLQMLQIISIHMYSLILEYLAFYILTTVENL